MVLGAPHRVNIPCLIHDSYSHKDVFQDTTLQSRRKFKVSVYRRFKSLILLVCSNLDNGTSFFLIYSRDCMKNGIVSQMLMSLHQPQIQIGSLCCPNQGQRSIEEDDVITVCDVALLIQRLVILQQWEKLTIFYSIGKFI